MVLAARITASCGGIMTRDGEELDRASEEAEEEPEELMMAILAAAARPREAAAAKGRGWRLGFRNLV